MNLLERLKIAFGVLQRIDTLEAIIAKIEALGAILGRLEALESHLTANQALESLAEHLEHLDHVIMRIENLEQPIMAVATVPVNGHPVKEDLQEWQRLQLLSKFVQLAGKAKEIEQEWQRIQQDEHDFLFAFQVSGTEDSQGKYLYKKGLGDGIKWCVDRFS
jgi:hypothetical protein